MEKPLHLQGLFCFTFAELTQTIAPAWHYPGLDGSEYPNKGRPYGDVCVSKAPSPFYMTTTVGFKKEKSAAQVEAERKQNDAEDIKYYIRERYAPCTGRDFELTLTVEMLKADIYADLEIMATEMQIKEALIKTDFNLKKVGDKRIAYARRIASFN